MYDLSNVTQDFPWTAVPSQGVPVDPWREPESNWFDGLPEGWGDVIHEYPLLSSAIPHGTRRVVCHRMHGTMLSTFVCSRSEVKQNAHIN